MGFKNTFAVLKLLFIGALLMPSGLCQPAFAGDSDQEPNTVYLGNFDDFIALNNLDQSEVDVFVSYTGQRGNRCGIVFSSHPSGMEQELQDALVVETGTETDAWQLLDGRLIAPVQDPNIFGYGTFFKIKTRSGMSLGSVVKGLRPESNTEVIVQIQPCK